MLLVNSKTEKLAKKSQNDKTPPTPVAVPPHWKSGRKIGLELGPVAKRAIFGQKVPKKCCFAILRTPFGNLLQIWLQIMRIQIIPL